MPQISVIVPVYKAEKYIEVCVDGILNQTFTDFELILVDDESPDHCPEMCDEWAEKDSRIKVIHKKNGGVSSARNAGLDIARGKYIAFCDSDDYWEKDFLRVLFTAAEENSYDVTACGFLYVTKTGNTEYHKKKYEYHFQNDLQRVDYLHRKLLRGSDGWAIWCRLFRAELLKANDIRFCTDCGNFAEDMGFVAKCVMHSDAIGSVDACLYNYIWYANSMMSKSEERIRLNDVNQVSLYMQDAYSAKTLGRSWKKYRAVSHYLIMYNQYEKVFRQERQREFAAMLKDLSSPKWFKKNNYALLGSYKLLKEYFGRDAAIRILLFSAYGLHRSWPLYRVTRGVYNKVRIKES